MFTDGVTEAINTNFEEFGEARLEETLKKCASQSSQQTIEAITADMKAFVGEAEQSDDITMLVIKRQK